MKIKNMDSEMLIVERRKMAAAPGKYASKRFNQILEEEIRREKIHGSNNR